MKDFTGKEKTYLFLGALIGFVVGFVASPQHQDKSNRIKAGIYQFVGAFIGFGIVYLWVNYKHNNK